MHAKSVANMQKSVVFILCTVAVLAVVETKPSPCWGRRCNQADWRQKNNNWERQKPWGGDGYRNGWAEQQHWRGSRRIRWGERQQWNNSGSNRNGERDVNRGGIRSNDDTIINNIGNGQGNVNTIMFNNGSGKGQNSSREQQKGSNGTRSLLRWYISENGQNRWGEQQQWYGDGIGQNKWGRQRQWGSSGKGGIGTSSRQQWYGDDNGRNKWRRRQEFGGDSSDGQQQRRSNQRTDWSTQRQWRSSLTGCGERQEWKNSDNDNGRHTVGNRGGTRDCIGSSSSQREVVIQNIGNGQGNNNTVYM